MFNDQRTNGVSRRRLLQTGAVTVTSLGIAGVATANRGGGVTKQTTNVMGPELELAENPEDLTDCVVGEREVYEENGATLRRNPNSISAQLSMATPVPGTYCYPEEGDEDEDMFDSVNTEEGPPEAFSFWLFTFEDGPDEPFTGVWGIGGHVVGGPNLNLSGQVSKEDEPFAGDFLEDTEDVEVHLAVAPHGALDTNIMPEQIKTPAGTPGHWWVSIFE